MSTQVYTSQKKVRRKLERARGSYHFPFKLVLVASGFGVQHDYWEVDGDSFYFRRSHNVGSKAVHPSSDGNLLKNKCYAVITTFKLLL